MTVRTCIFLVAILSISGCSKLVIPVNNGKGLEGRFSYLYVLTDNFNLKDKKLIEGCEISENINGEISENKIKLFVPFYCYDLQIPVGEVYRMKQYKKSIKLKMKPGDEIVYSYEYIPPYDFIKEISLNNVVIFKAIFDPRNI